MDWIINVTGLKKDFDKKPAVINVDLKVKPGEICGFLGPNGSGKTTTIRMLCGILTPTAGQGTCMGYNILTQSNLIKKHIGYMTQRFSLFLDLTIYENLNFLAKLYGIKDRKKTVINSMQQLDLTARQNQLAKNLSGGWKQRLALAATLLHKPAILLLDEPTAGVDPKARRDFWELLHQLAAEGITILLSTHNMEEVERCQRIAYMAYGNLLIEGTIKEIYEKINLTTWAVKGENLPLLAEQLKTLPGVEQLTTLYNSIHISGRNNELLEKSISPYQRNLNYQWSLIEPNLDDIFLWLASSTSDKRYDKV